MFEEICLTCGKPLLDDGRAYCSDNCQSVDVSSPPASDSTSSSAWSSPHLDYTHGGDVPPLLPSVLDTAPFSGSSYHRNIKRNTPKRYSVSSSSASSSGTCLTDEEDVDSTTWVGTHDDYHHYPENPFFPSEHKFVIPPSQREFFSKPSRLSYARYPSATNNKPTVTLFHRRSGDAAHGQMTSRSASSAAYSPSPPHHSSSAREDSVNLAQPSTGHGVSHSHPHPSSAKLLLEHREAQQQDDHDKDKDKTAKTRRTRNRASLPAYFSLLQIGTSSSSSSSSSPTTATGTRHSPHSSSSSSGATAGARLSPPTPKMAAMRVLSGPVLQPMLTTSVIYASDSSNLNTPVAPAATVERTPRGRKREPDASSRRRSRLPESRSRSRSRSSRGRERSSRRGPETTTVNRGSVEQVFDWSVVAPVRGRPARRNSSPMAKEKLTSTLYPDNDTVAAAAAAVAKAADDMQQQQQEGERRGRYKPEELARHTDLNAPGFGYGRSGLLNRQSRTRGVR